VSKIVPNSHTELSPYEKLRDPFLLAFLFFRESNWMMTIDLVSCHKSRRPCGINSFPASQVEAVEVQIFLSSQGSRKVNVEKTSIASSSRSVPITFESSEESKEVHPGWIEAFAKLLFVANANVKRCTLSFFRSSPHHDQLFRPLDLICGSVTTVRRCDATPPSSPATVLAPLRPHRLTIVELRVAYTRYPAGSADRYRPQCP
jgi:hypothetical protein